MDRFYTNPVDHLHPRDYSDLVRMALLEDCPSGDITSESIFTEKEICRARLVSREEGIFCGSDVVDEICIQTKNQFSFSFRKKDGEKFQKGEEILSLEGSLLTILRVERVLLNFLQYLSGISTETNKLVRKFGGKILILDTRKTLPGYRRLAKYAVYIGGGGNHRLDLSDMAMLKDNHVAMAGSIGNAVRSIKKKFPSKKVEVEIDDKSQIDEAVHSGAEIILLDNFSVSDTLDAIARIRKLSSTVLIECSGGITPEKLHALSGIDGVGVSMGYLTHTTRFLDLSLEIEKV